MSVTQSVAVARARTSRLGAVSLLAFLALSAYVFTVGDAPKLLGIARVAFAAMAGCAALGARTASEHPTGLVWGYGLASGAMVASSAAFLVPQAIGYAAKPGGFGIAAGILVGFGAHTVGHLVSHRDLPLDRTTAELSAHSLAAGSIIGVVYTAMPELGPLLGLAIVSHKGPAGYAAARRLTAQGRSPMMLLLPAAGVGIAALAVTVLSFPTDAAFRAVVFGFAAGIFLHVAMDFLPECETGSEVHAVATRGRDADHDHALLDRLRLHAVASTAIGGVALAAAWLLLQ
jgi:ZIP family zinc transporter